MTRQRPTILVVPMHDEESDSPCQSSTALTSRHSTSSESIKLTISPKQTLDHALKRVFFFYPFTLHRCCLGCVSLDDAVLFICFVELVLISLLAMTAVKLGFEDGVLFYTSVLQGKGREILIVTFVSASLSTIILGLTIIGRFLRIRYLYLLHIVWQIGIICLLVMSITWIKESIQQSPSGIPEEGKILRPSAIALICIFVFLLVSELWWLTVFIEAYIIRGRKQRSYERRSADEYSSTFGRNSSLL